MMSEPTPGPPVRPTSLTVERALSYLPKMQMDEEWMRKQDAGELPAGVAGMRGMINVIWPDEQPTAEEARWILALCELGSMRWVAEQVIGTGLQPDGMFLIEVAERVLEVRG